jgi:hypothetical protein
MCFTLAPIPLPAPQPEDKRLDQADTYQMILTSVLQLIYKEAFIMPGVIKRS